MYTFDTGIKILPPEEFFGFEAESRIPLKKLKTTYNLKINNGIIIVTEDKKEICGIVKSDHIKILSHSTLKYIKPKNAEQSIAIEILQDPKIPLIIISGSAGSGKTILSCAYAYEYFKKDRYSKIFLVRSLAPVGRDIGYLKGDIDAKILPWLNSFKDNFQQCGIQNEEIESLIYTKKIEITPITYIQGRSIKNSVIIVDEIQNLDLNVLKQIITRAGDGTKIILLGDETQVFERMKINSIEKLRDCSGNSSLVAYIHLKKTIRSPLAQWAVENL